MPIKVSVIVPVYNVEKYLDKCLDSLVRQTLGDIEIIVVNDGSPDNSQEIIDRFAAAYPDKIVPLRQENKGLGEARNTGTRHAHGEYVGFADSDDWVAPDMFELMYETAKLDNSDVVMCDYYAVNEDNSERFVEGIWGASGSKLGSVAEFVLHSTAPAMAWNKLFKRELVKKTRFISGFYEDVGTIPIIISNCEKIAFINKPLYYYLQRSGSITTQRGDLKNLDITKALDRCLTESNPKYREEMAYAVYFFLCFIMDFRREYLAEFFKYFREKEDCFKGNKYIDEAVQSKKLADLFQITASKKADSQEAGSFEQTIMEFIGETSALVENLDELPLDTITELHDMYAAMVQMSEEHNIGESSPDVFKQLYDRRESIRERLKG